MPGSQATPKPLTHSPGVLSTIFSGLSKSLAGSAKILYVAVPQPQNEPDDEVSKGPQPGRCGMHNALSMDFPGRTSMLDGDTHPGINIAAAIKLDTSSLTTQVAFSKKVEAAKSPCFYKVLSSVKTFDYKYNRIKTSQNTGKQYNIISIRIAKQAYGAVTTSSSHRRILSGSTLAPSTSPTSPRSPAEEAPTAQGYGSLPQNTAADGVVEEWKEALQEDCDRRMVASADGLDPLWVPAEIRRNLWAQEAERNSDRYRSSSMAPLAEKHDRLEKRLDRVTARKAPPIGSEDTINALSKKRAEDFASLKRTAQREKQTMQAIIDDLAKDLNVARQEIVKYEASKRTTIREGGSLLSDNLNFVESQKKMRNHLMDKENNVAEITPQPHTRDHAKTLTEQRNHTEVASETRSHTGNLPVHEAKGGIAKLEARNDELASSKNDLTSRLNTSEDRVRQLERLLSASNDYFATETSSSNSANAVLRDKVKSLSETVEIQKNLSKKAQDQLKSTTSVYKLKLKDQEEYYQQSLRTLKNSVEKPLEKPLENETQLRRDIKAQFQKQFQKQFDDAMKKKAKLRKEADARLEKRLISLKARGQQLVRHYAYLGIDLLEYMLKMEKLITSEGYVIENQEYDLFIAKARRALVYFKREQDDDAIFYGDEEDSEDEDGAEVDETEDEEEAEDEKEPDEDGGDLQGEEVVGQLAIGWRGEAIIGDVDGITRSQDAEDLATGAEEVASSQEDGPIAKKAAENFSFGTSQNNDTETTLPRNAAALSLNITPFTDTSRAGTFTTPPTTPNPVPKHPQPEQEEPRTKLGKTRAQVAAEVAAALALRKTEEEKEASTKKAEEEKKTTARNPRKTKAERRAAAIEAQKEAAEKEEAAAKEKAKLRKQRR